MSDTAYGETATETADGGYDGGYDDGSTTLPEITVEGVAMTEHDAEEYVKHVLEGTHYLGGVAEAAEIFHMAAAFPRLETMLEVAGPVGWVATLVVMAWETYDAFNTRNDVDHNLGTCYGVICETEGFGDPAPPPQDEGGLPLDSERSYWYAGLSDGRGKVGDPAVRNKVLLACALHGEAAVLNSLWQEVCQGRHPESFFVLSWPTAGYSGVEMG